jgi:hypothetical protein
VYCDESRQLQRSILSTEPCLRGFGATCCPCCVACSFEQRMFSPPGWCDLAYYVMVLAVHSIACDACIGVIT